MKINNIELLVGHTLTLKDENGKNITIKMLEVVQDDVGLWVNSDHGTFFINNKDIIGEK